MRLPIRSRIFSLELHRVAALGMLTVTGAAQLWHIYWATIYRDPMKFGGTNEAELRLIKEGGGVPELSSRLVQEHADRKSFSWSDLVMVGSWSVDDIVAYLKTGANRFDLASGPMAEVVTKSTSKISDSDLAAIATYLKDSGEGSTAVPSASAQSEPVIRRRARGYQNCSQSLPMRRSLIPMTQHR